jgi:hypothetical protein
MVCVGVAACAQCVLCFSVASLVGCAELGEPLVCGW